MTVVIGYCHGQYVDGWFHDSLTGLLMADRDGDRLVDGVIGVQSGPGVAVARNQIVTTFLETASEWLWSVDTDMAYDVDILARLLDAADRDHRPILGGLCFVVSRTGHITPTIYRGGEYGGLAPVKVVPRNSLMSCEATGAACLLVHRDVLEKLATDIEPWFAGVAEDLYFCDRARAAGYPIFVHTGIEAGHVKPQAITWDDYQRQEKRR